MTVRKHITMAKSLSDWIENRSKETGLSQSALIVMMILDYKKEEEAIENMKPLLDEMMRMRGADMENK